MFVEEEVCVCLCFGFYLVVIVYDECSLCVESFCEDSIVFLVV